MREKIHALFEMSFTKQLIIAWFFITLFLLAMFYVFAPVVGHILVIPVYKFNLAIFFVNHTFFAGLYRGFIWLCYFIPLLYVMNVIFTFIVYLCINNEMLHQENTFMFVKIAFLNSIKILALQLPAGALICIVASLIGITKTVLILTPFSTEIIRVAIFSLWLVSLIIIQTSFALKITLKDSLSYALLLLKSYKFTWIIFTLLFFNLSFNLAKGLIYLLPNFFNNGFFSNLCLTGFALAVYVVLITLLLHYLFSFEKPFELESDDL